ncbi:MAG: hypothetical protein M0P94_02100 [Candidatus Absconditabacterales bacterium]|nr:hypothetical protein [Candidatus Absconditabacterales bacterium]
MLIAVDKPQGISSFDIIRALKRELGEKKIGHSGTLDPMATGLLLIGTNKDTKHLHELIGLDKKYISTIDFSKKSDTRDLDYRNYFEKYIVKNNGIFVKNNFIPAPKIDEIKLKLNSIIPYGDLPLSPFSAKKKNGKKLYELAREGIQEIENKNMKINGYEILEYSFPELVLKLDVGSGTYIRSIGYRLGKEIGTGGILTKLRRISIGKYNLDEIELDKKGVFFIKNGGEIDFKYGIL